MLCLFASLLTLSLSINFDYILQGIETKCFQESAEKDSRYQLALKGNSSAYYFYISDGQVFYEDRRTELAQYKYHSAFITSTEGLMFCIGNLVSQPIMLNLQLYHGLYLQDSIDKVAKGDELKDMVQRMEQMLKLIEHNYLRYKTQIHARHDESVFTSWLAGATTIVLCLVMVVAKAIFLRHTIKFFRYRKII